MADDAEVTITVRRSVVGDALAVLADVRDGDDPDKGYRAYYGAAHKTLAEALAVAEQTDPKCPHGYERGDHHWFGCMGVEPGGAQ